MSDMNSGPGQREPGPTYHGPSLSRRGLLQTAGALALALGTPEAFAASLSGPAISPFRIDVAQKDLDDLKHRLDATRWPDPETVPDPSQGAQLAKMKALVDYWRNRYDWRRLEARLNGYPQFKTEIDGLGIHFLHVRSPHPDALPLIMTHGWPGSIVEFLETIDPLVNPTAHGGEAKDAFHVVLPSIPGYGFSDKPTTTGWNRHRIARAWDILMHRLGYRRYVAQGGDWGSVITTEMGRIRPQGLAAIHVNLPFVVPNPLPEHPTPEEQRTIDQVHRFGTEGSAYFQIQATRPETIGYALADSPVGQAAWIYEKLAAWSDSGGRPESVFTDDQMLDDIMFYWITNSAASSARMYAENADLTFQAVPVDIPVAVSVFPGEIFTPPKAWAERSFSTLIYWHKAARGGHYAAFEQPRLFVAELRAAFAAIRLPA
jgi:pimeloyl-ACP methyl ester carboxylesterase